MNAGSRTRVGIVGLGFGRSVHLPAFRLLSPLGVEVIALCSRDAGRARAAATAEGVPRAYGDWRELVADPDIELVSIATPPVAHAGPALAALAAGKAVLCEKPLALDTGEAERLALAAAASAAPAAVNFSYRALPAFLAARDALAAGAVGAVRLAEVSWHADTRLLPHAGQSWKDEAREGGGALASYGVHALDYLAWLLDPVERVFARLDERTQGGATSDDSGVILLDHAGGARSTVVLSLASAAERIHRIVVRGERGRLVLENTSPIDPVRPFRATLTLAGHAARELPLAPRPWLAPTGADGRIEPLATHAAALVAALHGTPGAAPSFADGLVAQRLLEAATWSAHNGAWLTMPVGAP